MTNENIGKIFNLKCARDWPFGLVVEHQGDHALAVVSDCFASHSKIMLHENWGDHCA